MGLISRNEDTKKWYKAKEKRLVTTVYNLTFMRSKSDHPALIG